MKSDVYNVGGSSMLIVNGYKAGVSYPMSALVRNLSVGTVYLGGALVTTADGTPLQANESLTVDLVNDGLYAVGTTTTSIHVLRRGD